MSTKTVMSGEYAVTYDNYNGKVDEVELVRSSNSTTWKAAPPVSQSTSKLSILSVFIQLLILLFVVIIIGILSYNTVLNRDAGCNCACDESSPSASTGGTTVCNSTEISETLRKSSHNTTQQMTQLLQVFGSNNTAVLKLLQDMRTENLVFQDNITDSFSMLSENSDSSLQKLMNIIGTLSTHKDTSVSTAAVIDDILFLAKELLRLQNASILLNSVTPVSCADINAALPNSPSGYYHVNSRNIYCNMEELCGSEGGWTRLAYLDMADSTESCPDEFSLKQFGGVRACGRPTSSAASCSPSLKIPANGISYSQVCGRVIGYQLGTTDAVHGYGGGNINSHYVDGISLTRGSPRQHVWTFMAGLQENYYTVYNCPCNTPPGAGQNVPSFIGSHYFCESANPNNYYSESATYPADPLWDGEQCGAQEKTCCAADGLPWFHRQYDNTTTDYMEMRICTDQHTGNEDSPVAFYEIFVK